MPGNTAPAVSQPVATGERPVVTGGLSQVVTEEISPYISFEEAKQAFADYAGPSGRLPVYYLLSHDVDSAGNASSWLFGVYQGNGTVLLIYDRTGWKINPWNATLPKEEILLDGVVPPGTLFTRNKNSIIPAASPAVPESRDLVLKEGVYTLTIRSGSTSRILTFNAATGGLTSGHV
jgi:hypothetical protein